MKIQDVEVKTGLDRATIRFYEKEGLVVPKREENGYRVYTQTDIEALLKIKLLRRLGVNLWKIQSLQQGSEDFDQILSQQIDILEDQIRTDTAARLICKQMKNDKVSYDTLDSQYYLKQFSLPAASEAAAFQEQIPRETHPWRRFFARELDYMWISAIVFFLISVVFRVRPITDASVTIISFVCFFAAIPILAAMDHFWATTPGKWVMGIRLEYINGGKLSGGEALYREGKLIFYGLGLFIPIFQQIRLYVSYRDEKDGRGNPWNDSTELIYTQWTALKKVCIAVIILIAVGLRVIAGFDAVLPTYRGDQLTIARFAQNHQDYEKILTGYQSQYILNEEGKWMEDSTSLIYHNMNQIPADFNYQFDDNGKLSIIQIQDTWENAEFTNAIPGYCQYAIYAVIGSRPSSSILDIQETERFIQEIYKQLQLGEGDIHTSFQVSEVMVTIDTETENFDWITDDGVLLSTQDIAPIRYTINLMIEIL